MPSPLPSGSAPRLLSPGVDREGNVTRARTCGIRSIVPRGEIRASFSIVCALYWLGTAHGASLAPPDSGSRSVERIAINDNRTSAGMLRDGVLTVRLEARTGEWH